MLSPAATTSSQVRPSGPSTARVRLTSITLEGASALSDADLAHIYAPFVGRDVSEADLVSITASISAAYRKAGYDLTRAIVPAQDLAGGRLRIGIIEGSIEDVVIVGDETGKFGLQSLFAPLTIEKPARRSTLERQLMLANDRSGIRVVDTTLDEIVPGSGRFRLKVAVQSWTVYGAVGLDNLGSTAVGPWQGSGTTALNSLLMPGDSLVFAGSSSLGSWRELSFGSLAYDAPIGSDSFRIGAAATRSEIRPGDVRRTWNTVSEAETYQVRAWYAPIVSQSQTLWLGGALGLSDIGERTSFGTTYEDHIGLLSLSGDYRLHISESSWTYLFGTFRQGLGSTDGRDASADLSRFNASTRFSLFNASIAHYQNLTDAWSVKLAAGGQIASGPLLITQQYYLGGYSFGRGFEAGWISGDNAIAGSAELRYDIPLRTPYLNAVQLYGFVEGGATETYLTSKSLVQKVASIGVGARFFVTNDLLAGVAVVKPVADTAIYRKSDGVAVLFSLTNTFQFSPDVSNWSRK